jgi:hypothetical protein
MPNHERPVITWLLDRLDGPADFLMDKLDALWASAFVHRLFWRH